MIDFSLLSLYWTPKLYNLQVKSKGHQSCSNLRGYQSRGIAMWSSWLHIVGGLLCFQPTLNFVMEVIVLPLILRWFDGNRISLHRMFHVGSAEVVLESVRAHRIRNNGFRKQILVDDLVFVFDVRCSLSRSCAAWTTCPSHQARGRPTRGRCRRARRARPAQSRLERSPGNSSYTLHCISQRRLETSAWWWPHPNTSRVLSWSRSGGPSGHALPASTLNIWTPCVSYDPHDTMCQVAADDATRRAVWRWDCRCVNSCCLNCWHREWLIVCVIWCMALLPLEALMRLPPEVTNCWSASCLWLPLMRTIGSSQC